MMESTTLQMLLLWIFGSSIIWSHDVVSIVLLPGNNYQYPPRSLFSSVRLFATVEESTIFTSSEPGRKDHSNRQSSGPVDSRPHQQRAKGPRKARRLNHGFRYLFRNESEPFLHTTSMEYLTQYYSKEQVLEMNRTFPPLLGLNVSRHLHPKFRFLKETLRIMDIQNERVLDEIPPQFFGSRMEKTIAPRHAFLVHMGLPHGQELLTTKSSKSQTTRWQEFLDTSRRTKRFVIMCNQWKRQQERQTSESSGLITAKQVEAFDFIFGRGILAAARDELVQWNNTWPSQHINVTSTEVIQLLIQHGANPLERDVRGTTLLHWAAGSGNLGAVKELLPYFPNGLLEKTERDGASPLHWAAAGANSKEFGTGGHVDVCRFLLLECDHQRRSRALSGSTPSTVPTTKDLVNHRTKDGNSPLMWAAWSGSLDTVKLMIRHRANWQSANQNGCTVAHWASSGGNLAVCKYLHDVVGVDFFEANHGGNTPLTHAVAFGRVEVVRWLRELAAKNNNQDDDVLAAQLAEDFVGWSSDPTSDGRQRRQQVLQLFQDDYWDAD